MLKELTEYQSLRETMKVMLSEIKKNPQGTNSEGKEDGVQINDLELRKEIYYQPEQNEETRIKKKKTQQENKKIGISPKVPTSKS